MKKKFRLIFLLLTVFAFNCFSQEPWLNTYNWDWTNPYDDNWRYYDVDGVHDLSFMLNGSAVGQNHFLELIVETNDYLPENGWVLLYKSFGSNIPPISSQMYPYFVLYNTYTSIVRVFFYLSPNEFTYLNNGAIVQLMWGNNLYQTSALSLNSLYANPTSYYHGGLFEKPDDIAVSISSMYGDAYYPGYFICADFNVAFDHLTPTELNNFMDGGEYKLFFNFSFIDEYTLNFESEIDFFSNSVFIASSNLKSHSSGSNLKWIEGLTSVVKRYSSKSYVQTLFEAFNTTKTDSILNGEEITNDFFNFMTTPLSPNSSFENNIEEAIGGYKNFSGKANLVINSYKRVAPTISTGAISTTGYISSAYSFSAFSFELPGTPHSPQTSQLPFYDCPLGLFSLEKTPSFVMNEVYGTIDYRDEFGTESSITRLVGSSLKLYDELKIAINGSVDVSLIDLKISISSNIKPMDNDLFLEYIDNGYRYRTPFIDAEQYKNTTMNFLNNVPDSLQIKIIGVFLPKNTNELQTPIVQMITYTTDFFDGNVTFNSTDLVERVQYYNEADWLLFEEEFRELVFPYTNAQLNINIANEITPLDEIVTYYFEDMACDCSTRKQNGILIGENSFENLVKSAALSSSTQSYIQVYPTLINDFCIVENISENENFQAFIEIVNLNGSTIKTISTNNSLTRIDMSDLTSGFYIVKVKTIEKIEVFKVMKI